MAGSASSMLDRQQALNALTHAMVRALSAQLAAWREDDGIGAVLVKAGAGPGVLRRRRHRGGRPSSCAAGGVAAAVPFFHDEYRLNWRIHTYPKPYVALLDGITMGGGVGISVHGDFRVATERTLFAMPETGIGFFPDVGGTWFLPRCPGEVGMYLGLTGATADRCRLRRRRRRRRTPCRRTGWREVESGAGRMRRRRRTPHAAIAECLAELRAGIGEPTCARCAERSIAASPATTLAGVLAAAGGRARRLRRGAAGGARPASRRSPLALTFAQLRRGRELVDRGGIALGVPDGAPCAVRA